MRSQPAHFVFAPLLLASPALMAQSTPPLAATAPEPEAAKPAAKETVSKEKTPIQSVEVKGSASNYDPRRDDTASKTVLNSEEIQKYGDTNVFDVLKRAPGVTVTGTTIRMRGLGAGYTQILVNGDRPPPGFSLDTLPPDQIERIEIMRAGSAEYSMQAIAGTINIVLRNVVAKPQRDARFSALQSAQLRHGAFNGTWAERVGKLSYFLTGSVYTGTNDNWSTSADQFVLPSRVLQQSRETRFQGNGNFKGAAFFPRLTWKLDNGDELNVQAAVQANRSRFTNTSKTNNLVGTFPSPDWVDIEGTYPNKQLMLKSDVNWIAKLAGGKLDVNVSAERSRNNNEMVTDLFTMGRALRLARDWDTTNQIGRYSLRIKFNRSLFDGHSLGTGIEASVQENDETRDRREQLGAAAPTQLVEHFEPKITRAAGYVQDEWSITKQLSIYLGTRWEGVQTDSRGTGLADSQSNNHVLSPVAQTLYKFPGKSGRQLRIALTRTYKAPTTDQLTARRFEAALNTRFTPDSSGNPGLQPELANGIDLAYEHFWSPGALFSVHASRRTITDYIRTRLDQDAGGRWLYRPVNDGNALVRSLETEIKLPLKLVSPSLAAFDVRASATRNWSQVSTVPGPDNRLDAQTPLSANVGIDYKKGDLGFGASYAYQKNGWVRVSETQSLLQQSRRDLDAYALWKLNPRYQVRLSLNNLLGMDNASERRYEDAAGLSRQVSFQPGSVRAGANLEIKL
jgi:outer membrane receptor for ferrienterochelin and colicin